MIVHKLTMHLLAGTTFACRPDLSLHKLSKLRLAVVVKKQRATQWDGLAMLMRGKSLTCRRSPLPSSGLRPGAFCGHRPPKPGPIAPASQRLAAHQAGEPPEP